MNEKRKTITTIHQKETTQIDAMDCITHKHNDGQIQFTVDSFITTTLFLYYIQVIIIL